MALGSKLGLVRGLVLFENPSQALNGMVINAYAQQVCFGDILGILQIFFMCLILHSENERISNHHVSFY